MTPVLIGKIETTISNRNVILPDIVGFGGGAGAEGLFQRLELDGRPFLHLLQKPSGRLTCEPLKFRTILQSVSVPNKHDKSYQLVCGVSTDNI